MFGYLCMQKLPRTILKALCRLILLGRPESTVSWEQSSLRVVRGTWRPTSCMYGDGTSLCAARKRRHEKFGRFPSKSYPYLPLSPSHVKPSPQFSPLDSHLLQRFFTNELVVALQSPTFLGRWRHALFFLFSKESPASLFTDVCN